jgi:DNA (cytosine-5)-methyltransferase 1
MLNRKPKKPPAAYTGPRVLDLFAGCGGMSLGFHREGFRMAGAVEFDPLAARSDALNFWRGVKPDKFEHHAAARDITKTDHEQLSEDLGLGLDEGDVVIGGPPCQSYARVGRANSRLRNRSRWPKPEEMTWAKHNTSTASLAY